MVSKEKIMSYKDKIPPEFQNSIDHPFSLWDFSETVTPETLQFLLKRLFMKPRIKPRLKKSIGARIMKEAAKTLRMDVAELTRQVNEIALEKKAGTVDPKPLYFADKDGFLCKIKEIENIEGEIKKIRVRLANFTARIVEEITEDNGQEIIKKYLLEGQCANHPLPRIEVPAAQFLSMGWLHQWGSGVIIEPGHGIKRYCPTRHPGDEYGYPTD